MISRRNLKMNKSQFDALVAEKEELFEEAMDEWQSGYLLEQVIKAKGSSLKHVTIHQKDIPDCGKGIEAVSEYLKKNGFVVMDFFSNEVSGKSDHFMLEIE